MSVKSFRDLAWEKMVEKSKKQNVSSVVLGDDSDKVGHYREALLNYLENRADGSVKLEAGKELHGLSMGEVLRKSLSVHGMSSTGPSMEVIGRAFTHSVIDFSNILNTAINNRIERVWGSERPDYSGLITEVDRPDFKKAGSSDLYGEKTGFNEVGENGEFKESTVKAGLEEYALKTYGEIFSYTRQLAVNDDVGIITSVPELILEDALDLIYSLVMNQIIGNPVMLEDGKTLYHADHGNLSGVVGAINKTNIDIAYKAIRLQKGKNGKAQLLRAKYLIHSTARKVEAEQFLAQVVATKTEDHNPYAGMFIPVECPLLDIAGLGDHWFLTTGDGSKAPVEVAYLQGMRRPYTEVKQGFNIDGTKVKGRLDIGSKNKNYRNCYKFGV